VLQTPHQRHRTQDGAEGGHRREAWQIAAHQTRLALDALA
jgi:hypothetical protein